MYNLHTQAAGAYGSAVKASVSPRQLEANVLLKAARQLEIVRQDWAVEREDELESALLYNRKLWTLFASDMTDDTSELPVALRNNIANLAVFVFKRTLELQTIAQPEKIDALIEINRSLAAGLLAAPEHPADTGQPQPASASV